MSLFPVPCSLPSTDGFPVVSLVVATRDLAELAGAAFASGADASSAAAVRGDSTGAACAEAAVAGFGASARLRLSNSANRFAPGEAGVGAGLSAGVGAP
jgi:hypothetical protein